MRIDPSDNYVNRKANQKMLLEKVTRILAIIMVTGSTFFFFIKLLFL